MAIEPIGQSSNILRVLRQNQAANQNKTNKTPKGNLQDTLEISKEAKLKLQATKKDSIQQKPMSMNMEFLALQNQMQMESRQFNSVSNALKTRHDSSMNAIKNMK